jgi:hypothetical protein
MCRHSASLRPAVRDFRRIDEVPLPPLPAPLTVMAGFFMRGRMAGMSDKVPHRVFRWIGGVGKALIPRRAKDAPPFKASKRVARIMYPLWYGRMTPDQARAKTKEWGFTDDQIERMIRDATRPVASTGENNPPSAH